MMFFPISKATAKRIQEIKMSKAYLVVDGEEFGERYTETVVCASFEEAQETSAETGTVWTENGWRKQGEVWVQGSKWRQKIIVFNGVEYAEEAGEDE
jgi:hypothetical protein